MSKEYIEREALIEELKRRDFLPVIVKHAIEAVPAADVAPVVHGHIVSDGMDELYAEFGECTKCGGDNIVTAEFCNWCGAKMDGGKHE